MKRLAQMVKEGTTVSKVMGSSGGDSSAISRLFTAIKDGNSQLVKEMCQNDPSLVSTLLTELCIVTFLRFSRAQTVNLTVNCLAATFSCF